MDRFMSLTCDVTDPEQVTAAYSAIEEAWGPVEVLVANAGITRDTLVLRMSEEAWSEVIDTNLTAVFRVAKRALTKMIRLHRGRVIMISSVGAFIGSAGQANYAASKAGLVGMARSMAREVASRSITVNVVAPGLVETNMLAALGEERMREIRAQVPLGRVARAEEVAEAVGFLASAGAGYVTGVVLPVDGGLAMGL
jgi:3-oxoacyl-[acyl-carrier protein] reductase